MKPTFTHHFVPDRLDKWLQHIPELIGKPNARIVEIGCHEGRGTLWMLEHLLTAPDAHMICIDPFSPNPTFDFQEPYRDTFCRNAEPYRTKLTTIESLSQYAWPELRPALADNKAAVVYVDSSHETLDVMHDATMAWRITGPGGVIVFDDYARDAVRRPVDAFVGLFPNDLETHELDSQLLVKRRR